MAALNTNEKQVLEKLFQMGGGYVLNFTDRTFGEFFRDDVGVGIFDEKYNYATGSKANRLRRFWQSAEDALVSRSIDALLEYIDNQLLLGNLKKEEFPSELTRRAQSIAARLRGSQTLTKDSDKTENQFIAENFGDVAIEKLGLDANICHVLKQRIDEIKRALSARSDLPTCPKATATVVRRASN